MSLDWIYHAISWILLRWHALFEAVGVRDARFLETNWTWVLAIVFLAITVRVLLLPVRRSDQRERANPLPTLVQILVFLGLFHALRRLTPDNPETSLYGWTAGQFQDATHASLVTAPLPARFASTAAELSTLDANGAAVRVIAGILVLAMVATAYLISRRMILRTGWAETPQQKLVQRLMLYGIPLSLLISGALLPIGVIVYWVTNNLCTLGRQQWRRRKIPPPATGD